VAERAGGVGDGVGAAEEVEGAHWVGLGEWSGGMPAAARRVRGRAHRAWRYGRWGVRWICPSGGRVGARVGGARCARGRVGWDEMEGEGSGMGGWGIGEGVRWGGSGIWGLF
jgi:hypothetical protein